MPLPKEEAWFPAKTYGWGWGFPSRWQGWLVMLVFLALLIAGIPLAKKGVLVYSGYGSALVLALVAISYWKGEKPRWSWGKRE